MNCGIDLVHYEICCFTKRRSVILNAILVLSLFASEDKKTEMLYVTVVVEPYIFTKKQYL